MKILTLHCDYVKFRPIKKAIKNAEELDDKNGKEVKDPLVVLTAVEIGDNDQTVKEMIESVEKTANEVGAKNVVIYPYAHLSAKLSSPDTALEYLTEAVNALKKKGFAVVRAPFGYYKEFELKCKGHPLSELSKEFKGVEVEAEEKEEDISKLLREVSRTKLDTSKLKENDHRILGQKLELFSFNEAAPGSVFWHKNGTTIFNELVKFSRELHDKAGYQEISTPQVLDTKLWKISGHWQHYRDNMFLTNYEGRNFGMKPMNCPGMMLVYRSRTRSHREMPLRLFEFGTVHRKELSGVLAGLFRVVRFTQDDAHIFCSKEQIPEEIKNIVELFELVYKKTFGFDYRMELSTRPEKFMGSRADWDFAEKSLEGALKKLKVKYKINEGDGAFYGPKIDVHIKDSLGRSWQCATIQLDMQMPERFELEYAGADNKPKRPIVIHRAIFGSIERFIGILLEECNGALPTWLSPTQVCVINFTDRNKEAVEKFVEELREKIPGLRIESDLDNTTVSDKVRRAEMMRVPYIIVLGDKEEEAGTLAVRARGEKPKFGIRKEDFFRELKEKIEKRI